MEKRFDLQEADRILHDEVVPAVNQYHFPSSRPFTKQEADERLERMKWAFEQYRTAGDAKAADEAMRTIINIVGTQGNKKSLYGGAGGSTDRTNPNNPVGQQISRWSDKIRSMARKEHERLTGL